MKTRPRHRIRVYRAGGLWWWRCTDRVTLEVCTAGVLPPHVAGTQPDALAAGLEHYKRAHPFDMGPLVDPPVLPFSHAVRLLTGLVPPKYMPPVIKPGFASRLLEEGPHR